MATCYFSVQLTALTLFVLMPVKMTLRPEELEVDSFASWALKICYLIDKPVNCCPSLHVALAFLGALATRVVDKLFGNIALVFALFISLSTMFVKQHLFLDVLLGLFIAGFSFKLLVVPHRPPTIDEAEKQESRQRLFVMLGVYSALIVLFYCGYLAGWAPWK